MAYLHQHSEAGFPTGVANMGGAPQNLMGGGLSQNMGGAWGELKMLSKIPVKEFDGKVASYKPASLQIY